MIILILFLGSLIWSLAPSSSIQEEFQMCSEQEEGSSRYFFSQKIDQENFYRNAIRHFLEPATEEEFQKRVREWMVEFDIPETLNHQLTPNWYTGDKIKPFEDILSDWEKENGVRPNFKIDEKLARGVAAIAYYIGNALSHSKGRAPKNSLSWSDQYIKYFLASGSEAECRRRIHEEMEKYKVPKKELWDAEQQTDVFLAQTVSSLHKEWQEMIGDYKFPSYITPRRTHVLENIIMFAKLEWSSYNMEEIEVEVERRKKEYSCSGLPKIEELGRKVKNVLTKEGVITLSEGRWEWDSERVFFMTQKEMENLKSSCQLGEEKKEIKRIYEESLFSLLRRLAERGEGWGIERRLEFIEELEVYLVEAYQGGDDKAFSRLKKSRKFTIIKVNQLLDNKSYIDSVKMFRSQAGDIAWTLKDLSSKETSWRDDREVNLFWGKVLSENAGTCPAGSISRPLYYIQEMYSWHKLSDPHDMFYILLMKLYRESVEKISGNGLVTSRGRVRKGVEVHAPAMVYNTLSRSQFHFLARYDQAEDPFGSEIKIEGKGIVNQFAKSFNPFGLGVLILELLQDPRCGSMCANLRGVGLQKELFMDNTLSSIRLDHFIRFIGGKYIVFDSPEEILRKRWFNIIKTHRFSELEPMIRGEKEEDIARLWKEKIGNKSCLSIFLRNASQREMEQLGWKEIVESQLKGQEYDQIYVEAFCRQDRLIIEGLEDSLSHEEIQKKVYRDKRRILTNCLEEGSLSNLKELKERVGFRCLLGNMPSGHLRVFKSCIKDLNEGPKKLKFLFGEKILDIVKVEADLESTGSNALIFIVESIEQMVEKREVGSLRGAIPLEQVEAILIEYFDYFIRVYRENRDIPRRVERDIPVDHICGSGYCNVLKFLVGDKGCDPNTRYRHQNHLLSIAIKKGYLEIAKYLVEMGANIISDTRILEFKRVISPLLEACEEDQVEVVKWFVGVLRKERPSFDLKPYIRRAIKAKASRVTRFLLVHIGMEVTEDIQQGLIANSWTRILIQAEEKRSLREFILSGENPCLEPHRIRQIDTYLKSEELERAVIEVLYTWKEDLLECKRNLDKEVPALGSRIVSGFKEKVLRVGPAPGLLQNLGEILDQYEACCKSA